MNKPIKFSSRTHKLLWISDQHQQHEPSWKDSDPLWKSRGFSSIGEHDKWLKDEWYKHVDDQTIVFDLGDRVFSDPKGERFRQTTIWPGRQLILDGNHRSGHDQIRQEAILLQFPSIAYAVTTQRVSINPVTINNLTFMGDLLETFIDGAPVAMQHRAAYIWAEIGDGGFALAGHSHRKALMLNPEDKTHGRILDVSVDNAIVYNGTPFFSWDDIKRIMAGKPIVSPDHH